MCALSGLGIRNDVLANVKRAHGAGCSQHQHSGHSTMRGLKGWAACATSKNRVLSIPSLARLQSMSCYGDSSFCNLV